MAINVNSIFPIELSEYCYERKIKFIHISTDCVFSGLMVIMMRKA